MSTVISLQKRLDGAKQAAAPYVDRPSPLGRRV